MLKEYHDNNNDNKKKIRRPFIPLHNVPQQHLIVATSMLRAGETVPVARGMLMSPSGPVV